MRRNNLFMTVMLLVVTLAIPAGSQVVDPCLSETSASCPGMRLIVCPSSDGEVVSSTCAEGYIEIWVRDHHTGEGIPNIPWTDYWINSCDPNQELCLIAPQPVVADSLTSELPAFLGRTTISATGIAGGGCVLSGGLWVAVQGGVLLENHPICDVVTCIDIVVVSPDITADCRVTISDFYYFTESYNKSYGMPGYNDCCDFTGDGSCTLSDFSYFAEHYNH